MKKLTAKGLTSSSSSKGFLSYLFAMIDARTRREREREKERSVEIRKRKKRGIERGANLARTA